MRRSISEDYPLLLTSLASPLESRPCRVGSAFNRGLPGNNAQTIAVHTVATACLAVTTWHLGEIERARELIEIANRRAAELGHPPSMAGQLFQRCKLEILRGDAAAALSAAEALEALSREHGLALFRLWAELFTAWARGRLHDPAAAAAELRQALATLTDQGQMLAAPIFYALLAELEAETFGAERALARIDEALALAHQLGQLAELAFFHRLRGEILLKRDSASAEPAEEAFRTAIDLLPLIPTVNNGWSFAAFVVVVLIWLYFGRRGRGSP